MCQGLAPTAMRTPISRVRSVTLTSMMFMIPMPPTTSDTTAMAASRAVSAWRALLLGVGDLGQVADVEVVVVGGAEVMAVAEERRDLGLGALGIVGRRSRPRRMIPAMYFWSPPWIWFWKVDIGMNAASS